MSFSFTRCIRTIRAGELIRTRRSAGTYRYRHPFFFCFDKLSLISLFESYHYRYNGELWFFDNYVIPLAKNLKDCGVFGVSSDECLNYAIENRRIWAEQGEQIVQEMLETNYLEKSKAERKNRRSRRRQNKLDVVF
jgi:hypothetical protein